MKKYIKSSQVLIVFSCLLIGSCTTDPFVDESGLAQLEEVPPFVKFNGATDEVINVTETDAPQELLVDFLFPIASDVTINFEFGGTAQFGIDFSVDDASASGGSITLVHDASSDQLTFGAIVVDILSDGITDGDKTLTVTLTEGMTANGIQVDGGQGEVAKVVTINIADADCSSDLAGLYDFIGDGFLAGSTGVVEIFDGANPGSYIISDFAGLAFGAPIPYEFSTACGIISGPGSSQVSVGIAATITGAANEQTKEIIMNVVLNCCGGEGLAWTLNLTHQ